MSLGKYKKDLEQSKQAKKAWPPTISNYLHNCEIES